MLPGVITYTQSTNAILFMQSFIIVKAISIVFYSRKAELETEFGAEKVFKKRSGKNLFHQIRCCGVIVLCGVGG